MPPIPRRTFALVTVILCAALWYLSSPSAPVTSVFSYFDIRGTSSTPEIYGLLHRILEAEDGGGAVVDEHAIGLDAFASEKVDWRKEKALLDREYPVVIFSKTYCPYSKRLKSLFIPSPPSPNGNQEFRPSPYNLNTLPLVIEVDTRPDAFAIKQQLKRITGRGTFPNFIVFGGSVGGADEVTGMHSRGELEGFLQEKGLLGL